MLPPPQSAQSTRGFSLFSLLVCIVVVAVLAALMLGAISRARQQAKSVACMGNLRQISIALHSYIADHNGRYPPNRSNPAYKTEKNPGGVYWQDSLKGYVGAPFSKTEGAVTSRNAGVFWCPADIARRDNLAQHSYGSNVNIGGAEPQEKQNIRLEPIPGRRLYLIEVTRASLSTVDFSDNTWPFNGGDPLKPNTDKRVDFRHNGTAHGLFLDGRVAPLVVSILRGRDPYGPIFAP